jgi:hypothetical protein
MLASPRPFFVSGATADWLRRRLSRPARCWSVRRDPALDYGAPPHRASGKTGPRLREIVAFRPAPSGVLGNAEELRNLAYTEKFIRRHRIRLPNPVDGVIIISVDYVYRFL